MRATILVLFVSFVAYTSATFTNCSPPGSPIHFNTTTLFPDPPVIGQNAVVNISGIVSKLAGLPIINVLYNFI